MSTAEGRVSYDIYAPPRAALSEREQTVEPALFFPVGLTKLAVMTVFTWGLYVLYWFYKSWLQVPGGSRSRGKAVVAALFYPLSAYFLFREVNACNARNADHETVAAGGLAVVLFLLSLCDKLPDAYALLSLAIFVPLLPVQQLVNRINARVHPSTGANARLTAVNIAWMAGMTALLLAIVLLPEWTGFN